MGRSQPVVRHYVLARERLLEAFDTPNGAALAAISSTLDLIIANFSERLPIRTLAEYQEVSRRTLERRFRFALGCSVERAIVRLRLEAARILLSETDLSITHVSVDVGFLHPSQLTHAFRREFGQSPSEYRDEPRRR